VPLREIRAKAPNAKVEFNPGTDNAAAAAFAKTANVRHRLRHAAYD